MTRKGRRRENGSRDKCLGYFGFPVVGVGVVEAQGVEDLRGGEDVEFIRGGAGRCLGVVEMERVRVHSFFGEERYTLFGDGAWEGANTAYRTGCRKGPFCLGRREGVDAVRRGSRRIICISFGVG